MDPEHPAYHRPSGFSKLETLFREQYAALCRHILAHTGDPEVAESVARTALRHFWEGSRLPDEATADALRRIADGLLRESGDSTAEQHGDAQLWTSLPTEYREIFVLKIRDQLSYEQIAERWHCAPEAVADIMGQALAWVARRL
ncbi:MAG: hypothetical protein OHK0039_03530 [Bacteroidia bacterium]